MMEQRKYDSTVARVAGNIASGLLSCASRWPTEQDYGEVARLSVGIARAIVAEMQLPPQKPE